MLFFFLWHSMQSIHIRTIAVMKQQKTGLIVLKFLVHIQYTYLFPVSMQCTGVEWWQLIKIHTFHLRNCANVSCSFRIRRENLQNSTMEITFWKVFNKTMYCAMASFFFIAPTWIPTRNACDPFSDVYQNGFCISINNDIQTDTIVMVTCLEQRSHWVRLSFGPILSKTHSAREKERVRFNVHIFIN